MIYTIRTVKAVIPAKTNALAWKLSLMEHSIIDEKVFHILGDIKKCTFRRGKYISSCAILVDPTAIARQILHDLAVHQSKPSFQRTPKWRFSFGENHARMKGKLDSVHATGIADHVLNQDLITVVVAIDHDEVGYEERGNKNARHNAKWENSLCGRT